MKTESVGVDDIRGVGVTELLEVVEDRGVTEVEATEIED
jgi:hypothetical protein